MGLTKKSSLFCFLLFSGFFGWGFSNFLVSSGKILPVLPWGAVLCVFVLIIFLAAMGWPVYSWKRSLYKKTLDSLLAFRVLVLAKSSIVCGCLLAGWHLGVLLYLVFQGIVVYLGETFWYLCLVVFVSVCWFCLGLLVEYFCKLPPEDLFDSKVDGV